MVVVLKLSVATVTAAALAEAGQTGGAGSFRTISRQQAVSCPSFSLHFFLFFSLFVFLSEILCCSITSLELFGPKIQNKRSA